MRLVPLLLAASVAACGGPDCRKACDSLQACGANRPFTVDCAQGCAGQDPACLDCLGRRTCVDIGNGACDAPCQIRR